MAYKYPICDVFHCFCKIARFFATEPVHRVTPERKAQGSYNHLGEQGSLQAGKRGVSYILENSIFSGNHKHSSYTGGSIGVQGSSPGPYKSYSFITFD